MSTRKRFLPSVFGDRPPEAKAAVDRRHSAGPNYAFAGSAYTPVSDLELDRTLKDQYERDVWVWRACDARAKNAAGIDVVVKDGRGRKGKPIEGHPLAALLNGQANPYEPALSFRWRLQLLLDLSVTKGAFVEVTEGRGNIVERVDLLNPMHTWPVPDPDRFVEKFEMRLPSGETFDELYPYKRGKGGVLWFKRPHPTDPYQSNSWIRSAGLSIDLDYWARRYNLNFLFNDGRPGGVLAIKSGSGDDAEFEGIDEADAAVLQERMSGGPDAAGRVTILEADHLEFIDLSQSPRDAQYVEGRAITQREILVAAGTPLSVIGDASGRTYDNADAEARNFWKKEMKPELRLQANTWEQVTPGGLANESEVVDYDWGSIDELAYDDRQREAGLRAEVEAGIRTIDSYLEETGQEPMDLPGTRVLWFGTGKAPIGSEEDVTALLTQGQSQEEPPPLPPGADPLAIEGAPDDVLEGEIIDPLDESQYAVKALNRLPKGLADRRRAEHAALIDRWTAAVADDVTAMLHRQQKVVLSRLKGAKARRHTRHWTYATAPTGGVKALDPAYVVERRTWIDQAITLLVDVVKAAFGAAGESTAKALEGPAFDGGEFENEVIAKTVRLIAEGLDARAGRLQQIIADADDAGDSIEEIAAKVTDAYGSVDTWAQVTSRSVVGAMNAASLISATNSGAVAKRWLATDDERTRPTHIDAEGQVVPIDEQFTVGEAGLLFPQDPSGPAGEIINCRCTMLFALGKPDADAELDEDLAGLDAAEAEWKAKPRIGGFSAVTVTFDPDDHPRDGRGRFLDVPDVTLPDGTAGVAVSTDDRGRVVVARADGGVETVKPSALAPLTVPDDDLPEPAAVAPYARYDLPNGRYVQQRGDLWILYDGPGRVLYDGDAEGMQEFLAKKMGIEDDDPPEPVALPGYLRSRLRTNVPDAVAPLEAGSVEETLAVTEMQSMFRSPAETVAPWQLARLPDGRYGQALGRPDAQDRIGVLVDSETVLLPRSDLTVAGPPPYITSYDQGAERHVWCAEGHKHWGAAGAAGVLVRNVGKDGATRYLMQLRSFGVQHGNTWSTPGGAMHVGEHPTDAGMREATEELGELPDGMESADVFTDDHGGWGYHTVVMDSPTRFETENVDREGLRTGWFTADELETLPLHPSFKASWPTLRARLDGEQGNDLTPHPENAGGRSLAPTWSDDLEEPMAATAAVKAAIAEQPVPNPDLATALAGMLARAGIAFDPTAEPSMLAGEHAAKAGQTGDGAKARAMIPTVDELIDKGMSADEAQKEWKRLYNNARFRVRDARLKAIKAGTVAVEEDKATPAPPKVPVEVLTSDDVEEIVTGLAASVLADIEQGPSGATKPKALYTLTVDEQLALGDQSVGPGGMSPQSKWAGYASTLEAGDRIPAVDVWIQGHKVEHGTVFKFGDAITMPNGSVLPVGYVPPILIEHQPGDDDDAVSVRAAMLALRFSRATKDVKPELRSLQTGLAWLTADNPADHHWEEKYGIDGFKSAATGGDGTSTLWNVEPSVGMLAHEFGHNVDRRAPSTGGRLTAVGDPKGFVKSDPLPEHPASAEPGTPTVDASFAQVRGDDAVTADRWETLLEQASKSFTESRHGPGDHTITFGSTEVDATGTAGVPTDYGRASISEDFAESVRLYLKDRSLGRLGYLTPDPGQQGVNLRFADMWPARARYLDTVFGNAPVDAEKMTAWQQHQHDAIVTGLTTTTKDDAEWDVSDGSGIDAMWPHVTDLELSFVVPENVVHAARHKAHTQLAAELKDIQAKKAAEAKAAAAALAAEEKRLAELAAKAKVAADAITAALEDAAATAATLEPADPQAVKKIRKRKAWVKWNAKQSKTTHVPAAGTAYTTADLNKKDDKGKILVGANEKDTIEFELLDHPGGSGSGFSLRGRPVTGATDADTGRVYLYMKTTASRSGGETGVWEPSLSEPQQQVYLDMIAPNTLVRVDKVGHSETDAVKIAEEYEAQALAALGGKQADNAGIPGAPPQVAGLSDSQVGAIIAGAQDAYDKALTEGFTTAVNPSTVELSSMEDGGDPVSALDALLTGKQVQIGDDQAVTYTVTSVELSDAGDSVDVFVENAAGIGEKFTAGDVDVIYVKNPGTPEDAAIARQDFIVNAVIQALAAPGSGADHGAPSTGEMNTKLRNKAHSWRIQAGKKVHPKAENQGNGDMQAKANIAAELASRLNNEADWEAFRVYRKAIKSSSSGDKYGQVPFDVAAWADTTPEQRQQILNQECSNRVGNWASTSGDNSPWSVLMQRAVAEEFATGGDWNPHGMSMSAALTQGYGSAADSKSAGQAWDDGLGTFFRRFTRVMWENTQAQFAEAGITEVSLYRGMKLNGSTSHGQWTVKGEHPVTDLQPANSWAAAVGQASKFSSGIMLTATYPVSRVLGSARTGFGCYSEDEFVVLNGPGNITVYTSANMGQVPK